MNLANEKGITPLMFAVRNNNDLEVVEFLAKSTTTIDAQTDDPLHAGFTALHFACAQHAPAFGALLVKHGARMDIENVAGHVPLWYADNLTKRALMSAYHARKMGLA